MKSLHHYRREKLSILATAVWLAACVATPASPALQTRNDASSQATAEPVIIASPTQPTSTIVSMSPQVATTSPASTSISGFTAAPLSTSAAPRTPTAMNTEGTCTSPAPTVAFSPDYGRGAGGSPVWIIFGNSTATIPWQDIRDHLRTEHGVTKKQIWTIETRYAGVATVQGGNVEYAEPLWFELVD
jgi:hypothetical protein